MQNNNHPNRGWRARRDAALAEWLESSQARCLIEIPIAAGNMLDALRKRIAMAYEAGHDAGRHDRR